VHERGTVYRDDDGNPVRMIGTVHDVTEQSALEERLRGALEEKELLLKEIYHRVKNNLQVVSSLLVLQGGNSGDPAVREVLEDSANRVKSMALVHEQLYQSGDLVRIDFQTYAAQLAAHLKENYGGVLGVTLQTNIDNVQVGIETAVPMGLIINELVSNAYKHAFAGQQAVGEITLRVSRIGGDRLELSVTDTGRGWPDDFDPERTRSLGVRLVRSLSEQLGASYSFESGPGGGACFVMRFTPELKEDARLTA
jgi:two-component sensor histidine kinase